jgi:hypothetical protein
MQEQMHITRRPCAAKGINCPINGQRRRDWPKIGRARVTCHAVGYPDSAGVCMLGSSLPSHNLQQSNLTNFRTAKVIEPAAREIFTV